MEEPEKPTNDTPSNSANVAAADTPMNDDQPTGDRKVKRTIVIDAEDSLDWAYKQGWHLRFPKELLDHEYCRPGQKYTRPPGEPEEPEKEELKPLVEGEEKESREVVDAEGERLVTEEVSMHFTPSRNSSPTKTRSTEPEVMDSGHVPLHAGRSSIFVNQAAGPSGLHKPGGSTMADVGLTTIHPTKPIVRPQPPHRVKESIRPGRLLDKSSQFHVVHGDPPPQAQIRQVQLRNPQDAQVYTTSPRISLSPKKNISFNETMVASETAPRPPPAILRHGGGQWRRNVVRSNIQAPHPVNQHPVQPGQAPVQSPPPALEQLIEQPSAPKLTKREEVLPPEIRNLGQTLREEYNLANNPAEQFSAQNMSKDVIQEKVKRAQVTSLEKTVPNVAPVSQQKPSSHRVVSPQRPLPPLLPGRQRNTSTGSNSSMVGMSPRGRVPGSSPVRTNLDFNSHLRPRDPPTLASSRLQIERSGVRSNLTNAAKQSASPRKGRKASRGEEDEEMKEEAGEIRCICGTKDDFPELGWVACDGCGVWQHAHCGNYDEEEQAEDPYFCDRCDKTNRQKKLTKKEAYAFVLKLRSLEEQEERKKREAKRKGIKYVKSPSPSLSPPPSRERRKSQNQSNGVKKEADIPFQSSPVRNSISASARNLLKYSGLENNFNGPFAPPGSCSKMTVAEQKQGLVAVHPIKAGFGVAELCGSVSVPSEVDSQPNPQVIFYSGIMDQTKDLPISEQPVICLDTRRISHDARHVRRCCRPNSTIRHCYLNNVVNFYIVTRQNIEEKDEITIPFDLGYRPSNISECRCNGVEDNCLLANPSFTGPGFCERPAPLSLPQIPSPPGRFRKRAEVAVKEERSEEETPVDPPKGNRGRPPKTEIKGKRGRRKGQEDPEKEPEPTESEAKQEGVIDHGSIAGPSPVEEPKSPDLKTKKGKRTRKELEAESEPVVKAAVIEEPKSSELKGKRGRKKTEGDVPEVTEEPNKEVRGKKGRTKAKEETVDTSSASEEQQPQELEAIAQAEPETVGSATRISKRQQQKKEEPGSKIESAPIKEEKPGAQEKAKGMKNKRKESASEAVLPKKIKQEDVPQPSSPEMKQALLLKKDGKRKNELDALLASNHNVNFVSRTTESREERKAREYEMLFQHAEQGTKPSRKQTLTPKTTPKAEVKITPKVAVKTKAALEETPSTNKEKRTSKVELETAVESEGRQRREVRKKVGHDHLEENSAVSKPVDQKKEETVATSSIIQTPTVTKFKRGLSERYAQEIAETSSNASENSKRSARNRKDEQDATSLNPTRAAMVAAAEKFKNSPTVDYVLPDDIQKSYKVKPASTLAKPSPPPKKELEQRKRSAGRSSLSQPPPKKEKDPEIKAEAIEEAKKEEKVAEKKYTIEEPQKLQKNRIAAAQKQEAGKSFSPSLENPQPHLTLPDSSIDALNVSNSSAKDGSQPSTSDVRTNHPLVLQHAKQPSTSGLNDTPSSPGDFEDGINSAHRSSVADRLKDIFDSSNDTSAPSSSSRPRRQSARST